MGTLQFLLGSGGAFVRLVQQRIFPHQLETGTRQVLLEVCRPLCLDEEEFAHTPQLDLEGGGTAVRAEPVRR
jgi:predicted DsbA family dithiol-disulfide isomerase